MEKNLTTKALDWVVNKSSAALAVVMLIRQDAKREAESLAMQKALNELREEVLGLKATQTPNSADKFNGRIQGQYTRADKNFVYALGQDEIERVVAELLPQDPPTAPQIKAITRVGDDYILTTTDNVKFILSA